ncbi:Uncharacterized protein BP5553_05345 [Venustampulla echinocandica]|uniref:Nucleoporin n=1 Tax=Venustampulla echinocandica TaxID=2656787 RepID=A0A370TQW8_9HELO|nr:Uncharacterized protein BP5553_05345 [Venustampulla echinocandica]RDL37912.1 Uncharacterized protein BP5553_05345 [Venustampulla echinocandica]
MFSPSGTNPPAASARTSRRRPRPLSNEGSIPKAKRQRSALSEQTFMPPDGAPEMEETKAYKTPTVAKRGSLRNAHVPGPQKEIVVRGKKPRPGDRSGKGDGSVVLTTNDIYTVSRLPALPDGLRADPASRQHGAIYSDNGYALTLTHTHAIVWPYVANTPSPETFTFALPHPSKHVSDPLPIGSLVSASASSLEPGLVVVIPTTGKIIYWESIASAATLDLRLQRNGVELSIPGMLSGEKVIHILNAESAGFMLGFSSGRIAYMSVRDGQGRPALTVQFLRAGSGSSNTGIFGSLRNALSSSSWHSDIAAIRAGHQDRIGERNVVLATKKGKIQSWDIHRGGHTSLIAEIETREAIVLVIKQAIPALSELLLETFELLDFAYMPNPASSTGTGGQSDEGIRLLLLTSLNERESTHYSLVEVLLNRGELIIGDIRPIKSYSTPIARTATSNTRLYLPNPAIIAYVVLDRAVILVSMAKGPDSPESQLMTESRLFPQTFEDVIQFKDDMNIEIVGSGMEEPYGLSHGIEDTKSRRYKAKHPAVILIVRGGGVLRIAAHDINKLASDQPPQVTPKSKLQQAVFFGTLEGNPISFAVRPESEFPAEEVGDAALSLSNDILRSQTPYIPSVPASIEQNLRKRSVALRDLAEYLKQSGVALDRVTRWKLLWDAERMGAATVIWKRYDAAVSEKPEGQKRGLFTELVECIHEDYKTEPVPENGELDRVRHWFINDIWRLDIAVPWAYQVIKYAYQDGQKDHNAVLELLIEANALVIGALKGAFDFRESNLALYGLQDELLEHGILKSNYEGLPEFWTSTMYLAENIRKQAQLAGALVTHYWPKPETEKRVSTALLEKVRQEQETLVDVVIRSNHEKIRWDFAQNDPQIQLQAESLQVVQSESEDSQLKTLAKECQLPDEAMALAEKHEILPTLASILTYEIHEHSSKVDNPDLDSKLLTKHVARLAVLQETVERCFSKFGMSWATAFYDLQIQLGFTKSLLDKFQTEQPYLTEFLRSRPEYAKIAWIHEITREKTFDRAAETLLDLGLKREQDLWSKKIELSMGKLSRFAGRYSQNNGTPILDGDKIDLVVVNNQLGLIKIQDTVYDYVLSSIGPAIDENAELQLALELYGNKLLRKQTAFLSLLEDNMSQLINLKAMDGLGLIDLLTLMGDNGSEEQAVFRGEQFYLALQASRCGVADSEEQNLLQRVIWRRCMLRDDWTDVNNTELKDDQQVADRLRQTALYMTFRNCLKNHLFKEGSPVRPINPEAIAGASTDELDHRFTGLDASIRESIMKAFQNEDAAFNVYVKKSQLEKWYAGALDLAKQDCQEEMSEKTEDGQKMNEARHALEQVEKSIAQGEHNKAEKLLHSKPLHKVKSKKPYGNRQSFRSSAIES